jgi:hypothetical protein
MNQFKGDITNDIDTYLLNISDEYDFFSYDYTEEIYFHPSISQSKLLISNDDSNKNLYFIINNIKLYDTYINKKGNCYEVTQDILFEIDESNICNLNVIKLNKNEKPLVLKLSDDTIIITTVSNAQKISKYMNDFKNFNLHSDINYNQPLYLDLSHTIQELITFNNIENDLYNKHIEQKCIKEDCKFCIYDKEYLSNIYCSKDCIHCNGELKCCDCCFDEYENKCQNYCSNNVDFFCKYSKNLVNKYKYDFYDFIKLYKIKIREYEYYYCGDYNYIDYITKKKSINLLIDIFCNEDVKRKNYIKTIFDYFQINKCIFKHDDILFKKQHTSIDDYKMFVRSYKYKSPIIKKYEKLSLDDFNFGEFYIPGNGKGKRKQKNKFKFIKKSLFLDDEFIFDNDYDLILSSNDNDMSIIKSIIDVDKFVKIKIEFCSFKGTISSFSNCKDSHDSAYFSTNTVNTGYSPILILIDNTFVIGTCNRICMKKNGDYNSYSSNIDLSYFDHYSDYSDLEYSGYDSHDYDSDDEKHNYKQYKHLELLCNTSEIKERFLILRNEILKHIKLYIEKINKKDEFTFISKSNYVDDVIEDKDDDCFVNKSTRNGIISKITLNGYIKLK